MNFTMMKEMDPNVSYFQKSQTRNLKSIEAQYHNVIYTGITMLTSYHPTTEEFQQVFEENMFLKNNSKAVQHVGHYLLDILDSERLKQKITTWPVLEKKDEGQFRIELLKYFNELNTYYEDIDFPIISMSHLVTPRRFEFAKFMLKLVQLCIYQCLMDSSSDVLEMVHLSKDKSLCEKIVENTRNVSCNISEGLWKDKDDFSVRFVKYQKEDDRISEQINLNREKIGLLKEVNDLESNDIENFNSEDMLIMREKVKAIKEVREVTDGIFNLENKLLKNDFVFTYQPEVINQQKDISLNYLLNNLNQRLRNKRLETQTFNNRNWEHNTIKIQEINKILESSILELKNIIDKLLVLDFNLENIRKQMESQPQNNCNNLKISITELEISQDPTLEDFIHLHS